MREGQLRFSLEEIPVPMVYATHRIIRDCNVAFADLFGYDQADLIDRSFAILYPKISDFIRTGRMWLDHLPGSRSYNDERIMMSVTGQRFWCQVTGKSFHHDDPFAHAGNNGVFRCSSDELGKICADGHARFGLQLDAVFGHAVQRDSPPARVGDVDDFGIHARTHGVQNIAARQINRSCRVPVEGNSCSMRRDQ